MFAGREGFLGFGVGAAHFRWIAFSCRGWKFRKASDKCGGWFGGFGNRHERAG